MVLSQQEGHGLLLFDRNQPGLLLPLLHTYLRYLHRLRCMWRLLVLQQLPCFDNVLVSATMMISIWRLFSIPLLLPIGEPKGITVAVPTSWSLLAKTGSALI